MPTLTNWNQEIRFDVPDDLFHTPRDVSEVQRIVRQAFQRDQKVTVVGALHSTTECMVGDGVVISMTNMDQVLSVDSEGLTATVQAGVSLNQLCNRLKRANLQPPVVLEFGNFLIGAISGTHANDTSVTSDSQFSSFVLGVKLVTPKGDVMTISETENKEYLQAIRSHFGMFGVVCEVTLRVLKNRPLRISIRTMEVNSFLDGFVGELQALKSENDQVFGMLFPPTRKLFWQCRKFVERATAGRPSLSSVETWPNPIARKGINLFKDVLLPLVKAGTAVNSSAALAELLSAALIELPMGIFGHGTYDFDPCDRSSVYNEDDPDFEFYDWVFPEQKWPDMVVAFLQLSDRFRLERDFALSLPTLIYFIRKDQKSLLSRSRNADMMAIDPTYHNAKDSNWKAFRIAFNEIAMQHGGIPHINKTRDGAISNFENAHDPDAIGLYHQRRRELDPKDLFLNAYFRKMFAQYL